MGAPYPDPDLLLARRAAAGQPEAWDELISRYGRRLYNLAVQFAGGLPEAEDLTQEIFVRLFENLSRYRGEVPLVAWALRLSRNLCIDHYRRARRRGRGATILSDELLARLPADDDPQADALKRQRLRLVYRALEEMPEELATAVVLRDLQGLSYEEAAAALELPMGTLKSRLNRARHELAARVESLLAPAGGASGPLGALEAEPC
jgi:RNA polymerase sigma-70 factor, ECF subfamily